MRIGVIGWYGHQNAGDERILYCLRRFFDGHEFLVTTSFGNAVERIEELNHCDYVLLGGGGLILRGINTYTALIEQIKRPFGCVGLGVEACHNDNAAFIDAMKEKAQFILVRDEQSRRSLQNHFKVIVGPDLTFLYPLDVVEPTEADTCGVNLRDWYFWKCEHGGEYYKHMMSLSRSNPDLEKEYPHSKWEPAKAFGIIEKRFSNLLAVPLCFENNRKGDHVLLRFFFDKVDDTISLPRIYSSCRYLVGMRLHSLIFACQSGIPFVSLSYQPKNERFCRALGLEKLSVDLFDLSELDSAISVVKDSYSQLREKLIFERDRAHAEITSTMNEIRRLMTGRTAVGGIGLEGSAECDCNFTDSSSSAPRVSVVLPTYNHLRFLPKAVESVLAQTFPDFELVIVNDGSTDGTQEYLETLKDPRIHIIGQENKHLPEALNAGFRTARGELLTWISADNYCAPAFLEAFVAALDANPDAGLAYSDFANIDENDRITKVTRCADMDYRCVLLKFQETGMASFMYRRACMEEVGLYDPALKGAEDWDMWLRISEQFEMLHVPRTLYYYRRHSQTLTRTIRPQIASACQQALKNAVNRLRWERLYPSLEYCKDRTKAEFEALLDFGTALVKSIYGLKTGTALRFLERAFALCPDSPEAIANLAVAYARSEQWEKTIPLMRRMIKKAQQRELLEICRNITQAYQANNPDLLKLIHLFEVDRNKSELFQRMKEDIKIAVADRECEPSVNSKAPLEQRHGTAKQSLRILFYYDYMANVNSNRLGGAAIATMNFAKMISHIFFDSDIQITGDLVNYQEQSERCQIVPLPETQRRDEFLGNYDMVFFTMRFTYFKDLAKSSGQTWVLYQHLWDKCDPLVLAHMGDFDAVICLSEQHKEQMILNSVPPEKLVTIPNLIDVDLFSPVDVTRRQHSIMYSGGLYPHKNVHILFDAFRLVRNQIPDAELHLYGDASLLACAKPYAQKLRSTKPEGAHFHGYIENKNMPQVYSEHSILCLPSETEVFPLVILEAQACGCIPVVHNVGGTAATMIDGQTGLLYSPNTPEKLAEAIIKALTAVNTDSSICSRAVDFVRKNFSISQATVYVSELLAKLKINKHVNAVLDFSRQRKPSKTDRRPTKCCTEVRLKDTNKIVTCHDVSLSHDAETTSSLYVAPTAGANTASGGVLTILDPDKTGKEKNIIDDLVRSGLNHLTKSPELGWNYLLDHVWITRKFEQYLAANRGRELTILDVGCGKSKFHNFLEKRFGVNILGVDRPHGYCHQGKSENVDYYVDFLALDIFSEKSVDIILWLSSIEHNEKERIRQLLQKSMSLLKDGGLFLATFAISECTHWHNESEQTNLSITDSMDVFDVDKVCGDFHTIREKYRKNLLMLRDKYEKRYKKFGPDDPQFIVGAVSKIKDKSLKRDIHILQQNNPSFNYLFFPSNDTHVHYMLPLAEKMQNSKFIVRAKRRENSDLYLGVHKRNFTVYYPGILKTINPSIVILGNDWGPEEKQVVEEAKQLGIPTVCIQEGCLDFMDQRINRLTHSDYVFLQGPIMRKYIRRQNGLIVTGNPKYDNLYEERLPEKVKVMINVNFTYKIFEDARDQWVADAVRACNQLGLDFFISQHPRDNGVFPPEYRVIKSDAFKLRKQLEQSSILISRFSTVIYEALMMGRETVYYNPHGEPFRIFAEDDTGGIWRANNHSELVSSISSAIRNPGKNKANRDKFLEQHCGTLNHDAADRCVENLRRIAQSTSRKLPAAKPLVDFANKCLDQRANGPCLPDESNDGEVRISVVLATYRRPGFLEQVLDSLNCQTLNKELYEVIVVDNNSQDNTKDVATRYPSVRYVFEEKLGLSYARNTGIRAAVGDIVAFIDDDSEADPGWLQALLDIYDKYPDAWAVGGKILLMWDAEPPEWLNEEHYCNLGFRDFGNISRQLSWPERIAGSNCSFRREVFSQMGHFKPALGRIGSILLACEEVQIQKRIYQAGYSVYYNPDAVVYHHVPASRMNKAYFSNHSLGFLISNIFVALYEKGKTNEVSQFADRFRNIVDNSTSESIESVEEIFLETVYSSFLQKHSDVSGKMKEELSLSGISDTLRVKLLLCLADIYSNRHKHSQAHQMFYEAKEMFDGILASQDIPEQDKVAAVRSLCAFYLDHKKYNEAEQIYVRMLSLSNLENTSKDKLLLGLGELYKKCGRYSDARELLNKAAELECIITQEKQQKLDVANIAQEQQNPPGSSVPMSLPSVPDVSLVSINNGALLVKPTRTLRKRDADHDKRDARIANEVSRHTSDHTAQLTESERIDLLYDQIRANSSRLLMQHRDKYRGRRCVIMGNGPSLNNADLSLLKNELTFGLNKIYLLFDRIDWRPTFYVCVNPFVIQQSAQQILNDIPGLKFLDFASFRYLPYVESIVYLLSLGAKGFSTDPCEGIFQSHTVTYVAMQLAYYLGFDEVFLVGVDHFFNAVNSGQPDQMVVQNDYDTDHFDPNYFAKGQEWNLPNLKGSEEGYRIAKATFEKAGRKIYDATIGGHLTVFEKVDFYDVFGNTKNSYLHGCAH